MGNQTVAEKIVQSLSFDVQEIQKDDKIKQTASEQNSTPFKIKIKIRKKDDAEMLRRGYIAVPKIGQPNFEKIQSINSDQTIMSFDLLMENETEKKLRKRRKHFFNNFIPGACLDSQSADEDKHPYTYNKSSDEILNNADKNIKTLTVSKVPYNINNDILLNKHKKFLGICKPGGCLDPPFSDDKYSYVPTTQTSFSSNNKSKENISMDNNCVKDTKCNLPFKNENYQVSSRSKKIERNEADSIFSIFQAESMKPSIESNYSNSIITYPPDLNSKEDNESDKFIRNRNAAIENKMKKSFDSLGNTYFIPNKNVDKHKKTESDSKSVFSRKLKETQDKSLMLKQKHSGIDIYEKNDKKSLLSLSITKLKTSYDHGLFYKKNTEEELSPCHDFNKDHPKDNQMGLDQDLKHDFENTAIGKILKDSSDNSSFTKPGVKSYRTNSINNVPNIIFTAPLQKDDESVVSNVLRCDKEGQQSEGLKESSNESKIIANLVKHSTAISNKNIFQDNILQEVEKDDKILHTDSFDDIKRLNKLSTSVILEQRKENYEQIKRNMTQIGQENVAEKKVSVTKCLSQESISPNKSRTFNKAQKKENTLIIPTFQDPIIINSIEKKEITVQDIVPETDVIIPILLNNESKESSSQAIKIDSQSQDSYLNIHKKDSNQKTRTDIVDSKLCLRTKDSDIIDDNIIMGTDNISLKTLEPKDVTKDIKNMVKNDEILLAKPVSIISERPNTGITAVVVSDLDNHKNSLAVSLTESFSDHKYEKRKRSSVLLKLQQSIEESSDIIHDIPNINKLKKSNLTIVDSLTALNKKSVQDKIETNPFEKNLSTSQNISHILNPDDIEAKISSNDKAVIDIKNNNVENIKESTIYDNYKLSQDSKEINTISDKVTVEKNVLKINESLKEEKSIISITYSANNIIRTTDTESFNIINMAKKSRSESSINVSLKTSVKSSSSIKFNDSDVIISQKTVYDKFKYLHENTIDESFHSSFKTLSKDTSMTFIRHSDSKQNSTFQERNSHKTECDEGKITSKDTVFIHANSQHLIRSIPEASDVYKDISKKNSESIAYNSDIVQEEEANDLNVIKLSDKVLPSVNIVDNSKLIFGSLSSHTSERGSSKSDTHNTVVTLDTTDTLSKYSNNTKSDKKDNFGNEYVPLMPSNHASISKLQSIGNEIDKDETYVNLSSSHESISTNGVENEMSLSRQENKSLNKEDNIDDKTFSSAPKDKLNKSNQKLSIQKFKSLNLKEMADISENYDSSSIKKQLSKNAFSETSNNRNLKNVPVRNVSNNENTISGISIRPDKKSLYDSKTKIHFAFQSYLDVNKQKAIKTLEANTDSKISQNKNIIIIDSVLKPQEEMIIPTDADTNILIKIIPNNIGEVDKIRKTEDKIIDNGNLKGNLTVRADNGKKEEIKRSHHIKQNLCDALDLIYEKELVPLKNVIKSLKNEIDELTKQQSLLKKKFYETKRTNSLKLPLYRKCGCTKK